LPQEVNVEVQNQAKKALELRCPEKACRCSPRGKLLATLIDYPPTLIGSGAVVQVACPYRKSRLVQVRL
jgi:hypothetical protein